MASFFPSPQFWQLPPSRCPSKLATPSHLIALSSSLRLGGFLHIQAGQLRSLLLNTTFQEVFQSHYFPEIGDFLHGRSLEKCSSAYATAFVSIVDVQKYWYHFFGGKIFGKGSDNKGKLHVASPSQNSSNERLWTNILLALNILTYVAQIATHGKLTLLGAKVNSLIDEGEIWRLLTSSFLHANIVHLMVNCYSLNSVGPTVEKLTGPKRFLAVYLTSAITSSVTSYYFCRSPSVGASGAIFGLVGSLALFILRHRSLIRSGKQDLLQLGQVIALNMLIGLSSKGIDNWGHVGGLLGGIVTSWFLGPAWKYDFQSDDGKPILRDKAPVFNLINGKRKE